MLKRGWAAQPVPPRMAGRAEAPPHVLHRSMTDSDRVVELHLLVIGLFGELQPDEEAGENGERDDDHRGDERGDADEKNLDRLHGGTPDYLAPVGSGAGCLCSGADSIIAKISSRVNSES